MTEFRCTMCGWCCKNVNINVSYSDILRWSKENRLDILNEISYIDHEDKDKRGFYITKTVLAPKRACPFLEETTCIIHDTEPRACAEFPEALDKNKKEKIECPAKWDTNLSDEEIFELKKKQALDFVVAEDRKEKLKKILEIAKTVYEGQKILKEFGEDPTEELWVNDFAIDSGKIGWTTVGDAPWLNLQDQPNHYVWTATKKAEIGDFVFANTAHSSDTLNSVTLYVYHKNADGARVLEYYIWDGTDWTEYNLTPGTSYGWQNIAVPVLDTWTKVDGATLYIKQPNQADRTDVDAAYLLCDYTTAGATYDIYVSDSVNVSDSVAVEHIYEIIDTYASDSVDVSDDVETETYKFFTSSMGDFIDVGDGVSVEKVSTFVKAVSDSVNVSDAVYAEKPAGITKTVRVSDSVVVDDGLLLKGVTKTWNAPANGNWEVASNWLPVGVPQEGDKVILNATSTYTCDINDDTKNLESFLMDTGYTGTLSLNSYTLYVENTADTSSLTGTQGTLNAGTGLIKISGDCDISSLDFTLTYGTSTVELTGTGTLTAGESTLRSFYNLKTGAPGKTTTVASHCWTYGVWTTGSGATVQTGGTKVISMWGTVTDSFVNGGGTLTLTVAWKHEADYNVPAETNYHRLSLGGEGAVRTATAQGAIECAGFLKVSRRTKFDTQGHTITAEQILVGVGGDTAYIDCGNSTFYANNPGGKAVGIDTAVAYLLMDTSTWYVNGDWINISTNGSWDEGTSIVEFDDDTAQTIANNDDDFYDIRLSGTGQKNFTQSFRCNDMRALNNVTVKFTHTTPTWTTFNDAQIYADVGYTLTLRSSSDDTQWLMNAGTGVVATRVDVMDSNNSGTEVDATDPSNTNSGNNDGWNFVSGEVKDVAVSDAVEVTDGLVVTIYKFFTSSVADFIDIGDSVYIEFVAAVPIDVYVSDTVNVSDSVFVERLLLKEGFASDDIEVSDSVTVEHIYETIDKYVSDAVEVSDSVAIKKVTTFEKAVSDDIEVSDSVVVIKVEGLFILDPDEDVTTEWNVLGTVDHFDAVDDAIRQPTTPTWADYVYTITANENEQFGFENTSIPLGTITKIRIWSYGKVGDDDDSIEITPDIDGIWQPAAKKIYPSQTGSWEYVEWDSLEIDLTDINNLQVNYKSTVENTSGALWWITCTYVEVTYEPQTTKKISDGIDVSDGVLVGVSRLKEVYVSDSINVSDAASIEHIYEVIDKYISDSIDVSDSVFVEHIYEAFDKYISDTINVSDGVVIEHTYEVFDKYLSDSVSVSDSQTIEHIWEVFTKHVSDTVDVSDSITVEHIYEIIEKTVSDSIDVSDAVWKEKVTEFDRYVSDDIDVSDAVEVEYVPWKTVDVYVSDAVDVSDNVSSLFAVPAIEATRGMIKFVAGTATIDTQDDISSVETKYGANLIPVANLKLNDKDGKYSTMSADLVVGNPIIISGSVDNGDNWFRLFSGSIVNIQGSVKQSGEIASVVCQDRRLLTTWTDFNNSVQEYKNFGELFTGSPSSSAGVTWSHDSHGNYPDGLLHKSNFTHSGVTEIYPELIDMPGTLIHHHETLYEALKKYTRLFAVSFFINPNDDTIEFLSETQSYPTLSHATISYGRDINASSLAIDYKNYAETIIVFGDGHFYQSGSGDEPIMWINESDLSALEEARLKASEYYRDYSQETKRGSITLPAYEYDIIGRRVTIDDDTHGWSSLGDVKELTHNVSTDRWTTKLSIENVPIHAQKTIVDVMEELKELKEKEDYGSVYAGFKFLDWNWDETESSDYSVYRATESVGYTDKADVPCLLAIGRGDDTASNPDTYKLHCSSLSYVSVMSDVLRTTSFDDNNSNYFYIEAFIDRNVNFTLSNHHTKEFVIYFYTESTAPAFHRGGYELTRPSTSEQWTGSVYDSDVGWNEHIITETNSENYIFQGPPRVFLIGDSVTPLDGKFKSKVAWQSYSDVPEDKQTLALPHTNSEWSTEGYYHQLTLSDYRSISLDAESKSENFFTYTHSVGPEDEYMKLMFEIDFNLENAIPETLWGFDYTVVARVNYTNSEEATKSNYWVLFEEVYHKGPYGWTWLQAESTSAPVGDWQVIRKYHGPGDGGLFRDGKYRWAIGPRYKVKANTDAIIDVAYFDAGYTYWQETMGEVRINEKVHIRDDGESIALSYLPMGEVAIYLDSDDSWFTTDKRIRIPNRSFVVSDDGKVRITDYAFLYLVFPVASLLTNQNYPRVLPKNPYHKTNWRLWLDGIFNMADSTRWNSKKYPQKIKERHIRAIYNANPNISKNMVEYEVGRDYEYRRPLSFEGTGPSTSDGIVWLTESIDGGWPRRPAYGCTYSVAFDGYLRETGSSAEGVYSAQRYKYINFEGYDDTMLKDMTIQYRTTQSED